MAREVARGEIWQYRFAPPDKRRPVVILSRNSLLQALETATVVPVTSTLHGSPTEVVLDVEDGLKGRSCANLANVFTVRKADLRRYVGMVPPEKLKLLCRALNIACGCD